jgi:hypothetical protein
MTPPDKPKLVISLDDLDDGPAAAGTRAPVQSPAPRVFPTVDGVRRPVAQIGNPLAPAPAAARPVAAAGFNLGDVRARNLVASLAGMGLGWAVTEILGIGDSNSTSTLSQDFHAGVWVAVLGCLFSIVFVGWEHIEARNAEGVLVAARSAAPWGAGTGFVAGFIANAIYHALLVHALESGGGLTSLYIARILGWGIFGLGVGATTAALVRARDKLINGALGGVIGGAVGGLAFEWVAEHVQSTGLARLIGLLVIGAGIGVAIGVVETLRREAWFHIVGGGMSGKEFVLYEGDTRVGSSPKCEITLIKDPAILPQHFAVTSTDSGARRTLVAHPGAVVTINGAPVARHHLRSGDSIGVGGTTIAYAERAI